MSADRQDIQLEIRSQFSRAELSAEALAAARALYVHIPFCAQKCRYCDFYSEAISKREREAYEGALLQHLELLLREPLSSQALGEALPFETVYFGGGTPSLLAPAFYARFLERLASAKRLDPQAEISLEANPRGLNEERAMAYRRAGINRLSLGFQTSHDELLGYLGRNHRQEHFLSAYMAARAAGFDNISLDLIFGLPAQDEQKMREDIHCLMDLAPEHFSAYSLILEEGTPFYQRYVLGDRQLDLPELPSEDEERSFYYALRKAAREAGYQHYEISAWAQSGRESRHNLAYWQLVPYLALGPAASGFYAGCRYHFPADLGSYIEIFSPSLRPPQKQSYWQGAVLEEVLDPKEEKKEYMMLAFRRLDGVNLEAYRKRFHAELRQDFPKELRELEAQGLIIFDSSRHSYHLTALGEDYGNIVFGAFV